VTFENDNDQASLDVLAGGALYRFGDWPNMAVPVVAAGVYTIWMEASLIYVGMAGRSLTEAMIAARREGQPTVRIGLASRLGSHASGRRSGDQFCVYVADRLVLATLAEDQIASISAGTLSLDALVRSFVRDRLSYRFVETASGELAYRIERRVQEGDLAGHGKPLLNPR
jgi:hypothetical protein